MLILKQNVQLWGFKVFISSPLTQHLGNSCGFNLLEAAALEPALFYVHI